MILEGNHKIKEDILRRGNSSRRIRDRDQNYHGVISFGPMCK